MIARQGLQHPKIGLCIFHIGVAASGLTVADATARADDAPLRVPQATPAPLEPLTSIDDYIKTWQQRAQEAKDTQPKWMTPLATITPRLEQEFRYDQSWQKTENGATTANFFNGKGLELIPTTTDEILLNVPNLSDRHTYWTSTWTKKDKGAPVASPEVSGLNDWPFFTLKHRFLSATEENGNYVLSGFLGFQAPIASATVVPNHAWVITPTLAGGKGWGDFDIQATVGVPIPTSNVHNIGVSVVTNVTFQYHIGEYFWPELELNDTYWTSGPRAGKNQLILTPGIIFGRFRLTNYANFVIGVGYQVAVSPSPIDLQPVLTPTFNHAWLISTRLTF
jgi:hypothetical protein